MAIPMPVVRLFNPIVGWLLRSPIHGLMSKETMLITFTGRKSGRNYTTPVSYVRDGDVVRLFTPFPWWRNLVAHPEVTLVLEGSERRGTAQIERDDRPRVLEAIREFLERVPRDDVYFERDVDGELTGISTIDGKFVPTVMVEIRLVSGG